MTPRRTRTTLFVFFLVSISLGLLAGEWYVAPPPLGDDGNPGTNELPFATIQHGIDVAFNGDTVIVGEGIYVENIHFDGKNIILTSTDPLNPTVVENTIIDGNQSGSVVTFSGAENETCILSGFTIKDGMSERGGGISGGTFDKRTRATIRNNTITGNSASYGGAMSYCDGIIENNLVTGDSAEHYGGGLGDCGGMIQDNTIAGNDASIAGGGLAYCGGTVQNNTITGNRAGADGGGLFWCNGTVQNNAINGNSADGGGGGLAFCSGKIQNNLVTGNSAQHRGGGLYWCDATLHNNTITRNSAKESGGGMSDSHGAMGNSIVWGNSAPTGPQIYDSATPTYSCIQDWTAGGTGNIALDPQFVDPHGPDDDPDTFEDNDYRLSAASRCIDAGINEDWMNGATDLDGKPRILLGATSLTVDMGAYELRFPLAIASKTATDIELSWTMLPMTSYTVLSSLDVTAQPWSEETTIHGGKTGGLASWTDPAATSALKVYKIEIR